MASQFEFIVKAIMDVAGTDRMEGLERSKVVTIQGSKKGFFSKDQIKVSIERSENDPEEAAFVTAQVNSKSQSEDIHKDILYDLLERSGMLDNKLKMKLDILFNEKKITVQDGKLTIGNSPRLSSVVVLGYNSHIDMCFPELKNNIKIEVKGDRDEIIVFLLKNGLDDPYFEMFFHAGVKLKAAVRNCRSFGVEKLVFIDQIKNEYMEFTTAELEGMDLM
jgi:hypothetical protein